LKVHNELGKFKEFETSRTSNFWEKLPAKQTTKGRHNLPFTIRVKTYNFVACFNGHGQCSDQCNNKCQFYEDCNIDGSCES